PARTPSSSARCSPSRRARESGRSSTSTSATSTLDRGGRFRPRRSLAGQRAGVGRGARGVGEGARRPVARSGADRDDGHELHRVVADRKSTRLNSSHEWISYAVFCLKKKKTNN